MIGPPGAGKTMLASRLPGILPPPAPDEALELATIAGVAGHGYHPEQGIVRPFRALHHSCSEAAVGGGSHPIRPARSPSPTAACCSSMSCPSSAAT